MNAAADHGDGGYFRVIDAQPEGAAASGQKMALPGQQHPVAAQRQNVQAQAADMAKGHLEQFNAQPFQPAG